MEQLRGVTKFIGQVKLFTDGGCRRNPGPGAIGVLILDEDNKQLLKHSECIGHTTNNRAEYSALIAGLDLCAKFTRRRAICFTDSELIVNQMNGVWRLKDDELRSLFYEVKRVEQAFDEVVYQHARRTHQHIQEVDRLLNQAFECR